VTAAVPIDSLPPGFVINNRYQVRDQLGRGATGVVYEVHDHHQNEVGALKFILVLSVTGAWTEAQVLTGLRGEFILPVRNAEVASGVPFIVTAVMPRSVAKQIEPGIGVDIDQAVHWVRQACRGVARIHDAGLLHNDIKPENLFLSQHDDVLVGDLGLACLRDSSGAGHFGGTAETMAPEVATVGATVSRADWQAHRPTTVASDVYSLGATLYWLLTGVPPFQVSGDGIATMQAVVAGAPIEIRDLAPQISQALADRVERAMARGAADRYQSASEFDAALGTLPEPARRWNRIVAHTDHTACFVGTGHGADLYICAVPTTIRTQHRIEIRYVVSGRQVNPWPEVPSVRLVPRALRVAFRDHA
jgi:serine/threonine-protein kinase